MVVGNGDNVLVPVFGKVAKGIVFKIIHIGVGMTVIVVRGLYILLLNQTAFFSN